MPDAAAKTESKPAALRPVTLSPATEPYGKKQDAKRVISNDEYGDDVEEDVIEKDAA